MTLVEKASVCETGGGFEEVRWRPRVSDGWMRLDLLLRRGPAGVGGVVAEHVAEDDPNGVANSDWNLSRGMWFRREIYVTAPWGTRFWRRLWVPNRERARKDSFVRGVPYEKFDCIYELRGEEKLVPIDVLAARAREPRPTSHLPARPVSAEEAARNAATILSLVGGAVGPSSRKAG